MSDPLTADGISRQERSIYLSALTGSVCFSSWGCSFSLQPTVHHSRRHKHEATLLQPRILLLVLQLVWCPGPQAGPSCSCASPQWRLSIPLAALLLLACRVGRVGLFCGIVTADLQCCEGVLGGGPSSNASQRHAGMAISGFSYVNPMDQVTTPTPRCLRPSPCSLCSCSASGLLP